MSISINVHKVDMNDNSEDSSFMVTVWANGSTLAVQAVESDIQYILASLANGTKAKNSPIWTFCKEGKVSGTSAHFIEYQSETVETLINVSKEDYLDIRTLAATKLAYWVAAS